MKTEERGDKTMNGDGRELTDAGNAVHSNSDIGLHEAIHAVIWRVLGENLVEVRDQDDRVITAISHPLDEFNIIGLMGPEVYMTMHNIAFTENSVSHDRKSVDKFLEGRADSTQLKLYMWWELEAALSCPHVNRAIEVLAPILDDIETIRSMPGESIHQIIDPILLPSEYSLGLKELLKERSNDQ
jgi:hypothetical protein